MKLLEISLNWVIKNNVLICGSFKTTEIYFWEQFDDKLQIQHQGRGREKKLWTKYNMGTSFWVLKIAEVDFGTNLILAWKLNIAEKRQEHAAR